MPKHGPKGDPHNLKGAPSARPTAKPLSQAEIKKLMGAAKSSAPSREKKVIIKRPRAGDKTFPLRGTKDLPQGGAPTPRQTAMAEKKRKLMAAAKRLGLQVPLRGEAVPSDLPLPWHIPKGRKK
jgi:hypothetical protein